MGEGFIKPIIIEDISDDHGETTEDEPLSPAARLFQSPELNCSIIVVLGCNTPINVPAFVSGFMNSVAKHPRFSSLLVSTPLSIFSPALYFFCLILTYALNFKKSCR